MEGVLKIENNEVVSCDESAVNVVLPKSITRVRRNAFYNCKCLSKVMLADNFERVPAEWFDSLNKANPNYEIICTKDSSTYNAVRRSPKLRTHIKDLALQVAKDKKIAEVQNAGADALIKTLLSSEKDSSFEILSSTKSATVAMVQIGKNIGVFKLGADSSKWLPKVKKVIEAFSDLSKSGADIFAVIQEQKLPLASIPATKAENMTLKADSCGSLNIFAAGKLRRMKYEGAKSIALFGVTAICEYAFYGCKSLSSVVIPPGVTEIGEEAFMGCNINEISHPLLAIKDGLVVKGSKVLYCASQSGSVTIPDGVTEICDYAFHCCESLTSVVIPSSVTEIGEIAFYGCKSLTSVVIPPGVTEIGIWAFRDCKSLTSVVIPEGVTAIGRMAFRGCESLTSVVIPPSVTEIGVGAFQSCESLSSVVIPEGVTEIGGYAFYCCTSLTSVVIPSSVTVIGEYAFCGCKSLTSVEFSGTVAQWKAVRKGSDWHRGVPAKRVKCADGEAEL